MASTEKDINGVSSSRLESIIDSKRDDDVCK